MEPSKVFHLMIGRFFYREQVSFYLLFAVVTLVLSHPCQFENNIDLRNLQNPSGYLVQGPTNDFFLNICGPVDNSRFIPCNGDRFIPSIMFNKRNITECNAISRTPENPSDVQVKWLDSQNHNRGVKLSYLNGRRFLQEGKLLGSKTEIEIFCRAPHPNGTNSPKFKSMTQVGEEFVYSFTMESEYACPSGQPRTICVLNTSDGIIDLRPQQFRIPVTVFGRGFWDLAVNICAPASSCRNKMAPAVYHIFNDPSNCHHISSTPSSLNIILKLKNPSNPKMGVILSYLNGDRFEQEGQMLGSETEFDIECDPDVNDPRPSLEENFIRNGNMVYLLKMRSKFACPK